MTPRGASKGFAMGSPLVQFERVSRTYRTAGGVPFVALDDVTLSVDPGEFVAVVGPSGSGKSTLLNMVGGIDRPTEGRVVVDGADVSAMDENTAAAWRGRTIGVVFQFFQLLPTLSLVDNVVLPMDFCHVHPRRDREGIARDLLGRVGLADHADKRPAELSGGQQQRAAIARALANDPPVLLGDEPTGNLDSVAARTMIDLFDELVAGGRTILMVTHDRELAARTHRVVEVRDGAIVGQPLPVDRPVVLS